MNIPRPQLLAIAFFLLAPTAGFAQAIMPRNIESIDVRVLDAENVVIAKLVTVTSSSDRAVALVAVEETLKGDHQEFRQVELRASGDSKHVRRLYEDNKTARLLFYDSTFAVLDSIGPKYELLGGGTIRGADEVIPYLREVIRSNPGWKKGKLGQTFPLGRLIVPIDARLEKWAIEKIGTYIFSDSRRYEAVQALRLFKSDANIVRMRRLLKDTTSTIATTRSVARRFYYIRQAAYEALKNWDVQVDAPLSIEALPMQ
jgi:hypothetical protein